MLPSLELIVNPHKSKIYQRLLVLIYGITVLSVIYSSLFLLLKILLIICTTFQFKNYFIQQKPHPELYEIKYTRQQWLISMQNGQQHTYHKAIILIHNIFFQVLKLSNLDENKIVILFNDQLTSHQLRLLHLKTSKIGI